MLLGSAPGVNRVIMFGLHVAEGFMERSELIA